MTRRQRVDSTEAAVEIARAAGQQIAPPSNVPLTDEDLPFFASVIDEFARSEWTAHQLELAAMLARDMCDRAAAQRKLRAEGEVVISEKGHRSVNPLRTTVQALAGSIYAGRRSLQLHARARAGEARDTGARRAQAKEIEGGISDDDLLARPN